MAKSEFQFDMKEETTLERVLLVCVEFTRSGDPRTRASDFRDHIIEAEDLILAADGNLVETVTCKKDKPDTTYFVGSGKAKEIQDIARSLNVDLIVVNHEITPSQQRNLEKLTDVRVIDRVGLILAIFAKRAQTQEGKLQVELAQLQYLQSRLVRVWSHLQSQKGGIGLKGPGETQLETDRRLIGDKVNYLQRKLKEVKKRRDTQRKSRFQGGTPVMSLVGYTNTGKSTLFNRLTKSKVFTKNQVFATLDPTARRLWLDNEHSIILTDTVGFIRNLPTSLIAAFSATLEETKYADVLLHVVDVANPAYPDQIDNVNKVLREIGADGLPQLMIYNKIDLTDDQEPAVFHSNEGELKGLRISVKESLGLDDLRTALCEASDQWCSDKTRIYGDSRDSGDVDVASLEYRQNRYSYSNALTWDLIKEKYPGYDVPEPEDDKGDYDARFDDKVGDDVDHLADDDFGDKGWDEWDEDDSGEEAHADGPQRKNNARRNR